MTFVSHGEVDIRKQIIDPTLKGFAKRLYKLKPLLNIVTTGAWRNDYWRASPDTLTAGTTRDIKGIPRGAAFPQASTSFEKIRTDIEKYGLEDSIPWEDIISGEVAVRDQTLIRIAEGIVYSIDRQIWTSITADTDIQTFTIDSQKEWDNVSAAILDDLEYAEQLIGTQHYPTDNLAVVINHYQKRKFMKFLFDNGAQIPSVADQAVRNGVIGTLGNKTFIVSDVVTASQALVMIPKRNNWKELYALSTDVQNEPYKDVRVRAVELGVVQITDPKTIVWIKNTQNSA